MNFDRDDYSDDYRLKKKNLIRRESSIVSVNKQERTSLKTWQPARKLLQLSNL